MLCPIVGNNLAIKKDLIFPSREKFIISDFIRIILKLCFANKFLRVLKVKYLIWPELSFSLGDNSIIGLIPTSNINLLPKEAILGVEIKNLPPGFNILKTSSRKKSVSKICSIISPATIISKKLFSKGMLDLSVKKTA